MYIYIVVKMSNSSLFRFFVNSFNELSSYFDFFPLKTIIWFQVTIDNH